jgi:peptide/nickel transport system ATP-binding protein
MSGAPLLDVEKLGVRYATPAGDIGAVRDVSFSVDKGEALGLVGESGSGKSTVALAIMGLLGSEATISGGRILFGGRDLARLQASELRTLRGDRLSIVFQDPFASLNPGLTVGLQVAEPLIHHRGVPRREALARAEAALAEVGLPRPRDLLSAYPHQLSGGMQQRMLIAAALICEPDLIILDEPTTALDVTIEAQILDLLDMLRRRRKLAMLFITHNLGVVNRICDRTCVLYAGSVLEQGPKDLTLGRPLHPYTLGLLGSVPRLGRGRLSRLTPIAGRFPDLARLPPGCVFHPRCPHVLPECRIEPQLLRPLAGGEVRCWRAGSLPQGDHEAPQARGERPAQTQAALLAAQDIRKVYPLGARIRLGGRHLLRLERRETRAVDGVSLTIRPGEVLGLVGESGSGKSTLGRCMARLIDPTQGRILFAGEDVTAARGAGLRRFRGEVQIIFQNPTSSLNPRRRVGATIGRSLDLLGSVTGAGKQARIGALLDSVGLPAEFASRFPHQLSGGERQRVSIARALASNPKFVICDEPVSALDVSVQATVLNLLADLRDRLHLAYLFISHDLSSVAHIADRIAVMYAGVICEEGPTEAVLAPPFHPYTEALLSAVPSVEPASPERGRIRLRGDAGAPVGAPVGCRFHGRCPRKIGPICENEVPPRIEVGKAHWISCHLPIDDLTHPSPLQGGAARQETTPSRPGDGNPSQRSRRTAT